MHFGMFRKFNQYGAEQLYCFLLTSEGVSILNELKQRYNKQLFKPLLNNIIASMILERQDDPCNDGFMLSHWASSQRGAGKILLANVFNHGVTLYADRYQVSELARTAILKMTKLAKSGTIIIKPLDNESRPVTPDREDDCITYTNTGGYTMSNSGEYISKLDSDISGLDIKDYMDFSASFANPSYSPPSVIDQKEIDKMNYSAMKTIENAIMSHFNLEIGASTNQRGRYSNIQEVKIRKMKLTEGQIRKIISKSIKEAYKGQIGGKLKQNPETGEWEREEGPIVFDTDDQSDIAKALGDQGSNRQTGTIPKTKPSVQKKGVGKLYQSKLFKKNASWMFGPRALPNSNVYIIPIAGSNREASDLLFGYQVQRPESRTFGAIRKGLTDQEEIIATEKGIHEDLQRHIIVDIQNEGLQILTNLGLNIAEMNAIDKEKDIIFVPITSGVARNFTGTPHLLIHAMMDPGFSTTKTDKFFYGVLEKYFEHCANPIARHIDAKYPDDKYKSFREYERIMNNLGTTKAFRDNRATEQNDRWAEMMTQEFTMQKSKLKNRVPKEPGLSFNKEILLELPSEIVSNLFYFRKVLRAYMAEYRKYLQGKIVIINQF